MFSPEFRDATTSFEAAIARITGRYPGDECWQAMDAGERDQLQSALRGWQHRIDEVIKRIE
jgi:hypothetical protein